MPRVAVFARLANGNVAPKRVIEGQNTKLSRTMHGIAFDSVHDEFFLPVALSGAVLVFRGGASGEEAPIRVIQGDRTRLIRPQTVEVDPKNGEIFVADPSTRSVLVFAREANGNAAPLREVGGPKTNLLEVIGLAIDPVRNLLIVGQRGATEELTGLLIFHRTDNGNVAPQSIIAGHQTHLAAFRQLALDQENGKIYVAVQSQRYKGPAPYEIDKVRAGVQDRATRRRPQPFSADDVGFIGVWDVNDSGDVPPRAVIKGPASRLLRPAGVGLNPRYGEIIAVDGDVNGFLTFLLPQFFEKTFWIKGR